MFDFLKINLFTLLSILRYFITKVLKINNNKELAFQTPLHASDLNFMRSKPVI